MSTWSALPDEIVEHVLSYCVAYGLRDIWIYRPLSSFEHNPNACGFQISYIFYFLRILQFEKRCRYILKGMCVFKICKVNGRIEYDFRKGILHK
jgi:hypothetical protein